MIPYLLFYSFVVFTIILQCRKLFLKKKKKKNPWMNKSRCVRSFDWFWKYSDSLLWDWKLTSGASCFHWPSLRCFYNLIGVQLWSIQLIGHDLERHIPVYIMSHIWHCISEQKQSHEVEGIVRRAPRQDCVEAQIWGRVPKHFCSIEGLQEHCGLHHS